LIFIKTRIIIQNNLTNTIIVIRIIFEIIIIIIIIIIIFDYFIFINFILIAFDYSIQLILDFFSNQIICPIPIEEFRILNQLIITN